MLTGMGASLAACQPAHLRLLGAGAPAWLVESGELLHYGTAALTDRTLLVVASQSGRSAEVEALLDAAKRGGAVVGVTNDPTSPLARRADATLLLHAGAERTGVSTKTYVTLVAALLRAAALLAGEADPAPALRTAVAPLQRHLDAAERHVAWWRDAVELPQALFVLGRGPSLAAVADRALTIKEAARVAAEGMSVA